jgi:hypothetical protein
MSRFRAFTLSEQDHEGDLSHIYLALNEATEQGALFWSSPDNVDNQLSKDCSYW